MEFGQKLAEIFSKGIAEIGQEVKRIGIQGAAELGSGLFSESNAYVPYGPGQNRESGVHGMEGLHNDGHEMQHEHDGHSM